MSYGRDVLPVMGKGGRQWANRELAQDGNGELAKCVVCHQPVRFHVEAGGIVSDCGHERYP